jgi:hypothetical protein
METVVKRVPCFIPSYMRAGNVLTLDSIPLHLLYPVLVVHKSEKKKYQKKHPKVKVIATSDKGIGKTRAFICRYALKHGHDVVAMLDDDVNGWLWKEQFAAMGTIRTATEAERDKRWAVQLKRARNLAGAGIGYAASFTYRFALAAPNREYTTGIKLRIGLVNECMLMNKQAMEHARFTLETCEDIESTLHWLSHGVIAGQDQRLGHTSPKTALTAERGGCGEYREQTEGFHLRNHRKLWKLFPNFVAKPKDEGKRRGDGMVMLKTRVGYSKAAKAGGVI